MPDAPDPEEPHLAVMFLTEGPRSALTACGLIPRSVTVMTRKPTEADVAAHRVQQFGQPAGLEPRSGSHYVRRVRLPNGPDATVADWCEAFRRALAGETLEIHYDDFRPGEEPLTHP